MHSRPFFSRETISTFQSQDLTYNPNEKIIIINVSIISKIKKHLCKYVEKVSIQSVIFDQ